MERARLEELLHTFPQKRVGIVGDFCMDVYWHADMTRSLLSRETPRFPLPVVREEFFGGAASNVAWNVAELGIGTVFAITVFGDDWRGRELSTVLAERHGVDLRYVVTAPGRMTPAFCKPIRHGFQSEQEDSRLDFENATPAPRELEDQIVANLAECMPQLDALSLDESENTILGLAAFSEGRASLADVPNILYRRDGECVGTRFEKVSDLDSLPYPEYSPDAYPSLHGASKLKVGIIFDNIHACIRYSSH